MDAERLADYLAGELDADERAAVEAALARDPALRSQLERLREVDELLRRVAPSTPREGFEERLHAGLAPEISAHLDAGGDALDAGPGAEPAGPRTADEVTARRELRATRGSPRWPVALGGVAAGLAGLAVVGLALTALPWAADDADDVAMDALEEQVTEDADVAEGELMSALGPDGPILVATDRDLTDAEVEALLAEPALVDLRARGVAADEGPRLAEAWRGLLVDDEQLWRESTEAYAASGPAADTRDDAATPDDEAEVAEEEARPTPQWAGARAPDPEAQQDVRRCLDVLLEDAPEVIPVYVEVAAFEGEPAIAYGMLAPGAGNGAYERIEVWVVDRADCQVRTLRQHDA